MRSVASAAASSTPSRRYAVGVKPQLAFFEALGADGMRAFEDVCAYARTAGLIVLADAKRGDIGSTSRAYAAAYLEPREDQPPLADAMTVNPYLGRDSLEPLIAACRREGAGIFCLVKTSNEGVADIQDLALRRAPALAARGPARRGVGRGSRRRARPLQRRRGRRRDPSARDRRGSASSCPQAVLLLPGVGAQGATPGRRRARLHERPGERARRRLPRRCCTPSGRPTTTGGQRPRAEAARLKSEVWTASGW